jgi:gas vesicle protein
MAKKTNTKETPRKRSGGKVFTGILTGAALGVAAALLLTSPNGKKLRKDLSKRAADFYTYISPQLKKLRTMSQKEYEVFIDQAVKQYGRLKKMSGPEMVKLTKEAKKVWGQVTKYL